MAEVAVDDETGEVVVEKLVQVYDVGRAINPTLLEGQIEGGAIMGLGLGLLEESYPYYPSPDHRGGEFGSYLGPALHDLPELDNVILENPSADGPFGAKAIGEMANNAQPPAIANAIYDAVGVWVTEMPARPERVLEAIRANREPRREGKRVIFDEHLSVRTVSSNGGAGYLGWSLSGRDGRARPLPDLERPRALADPRGRPAARDRRRAGAALPGRLRARHAGRWHSHEHTEQVMLILDGEVEMTIEDEARTLGPGDVVVVNRGLRHTLHSPNGVTFIEALAPVPLDHVPGPRLDLVLGPDGGAAHVER